MADFKDFLTSNKACYEAVAFASDIEFDPISVYEKCERNDWLIWWAGKKGVCAKTLVELALDLAETEQHTMVYECKEAIETGRDVLAGNIGPMGETMWVEWASNTKAAGSPVEAACAAWAWACGFNSWEVAVKVIRVANLAGEAAKVGVVAKQRAIIDSHLKALLIGDQPDK